MASKSNPVKIFIAYSRLDGEYLKELRKHLKPLDRNKTIRIWYDGEIAPGSIWEQSIKDNLYAADIILLLVSANSLASDYFYEEEMADALARHEREEAIVVPIILDYCSWKITELNKLQALPKDGKPVSEWESISKAYTNIVEGLNQSVLEVKAKQKATAAEILQKKREAEAERQRKIDAAKEQERLAQLQRQTEETQKKQQIAAERLRKKQEEEERLRQLELQKEREKLAQQKREAEQKRLTQFKQSLLEADKALLHQNWAAAISAFEESLQYYKTGDQPDKKSIEQNIKNAKEKQREAQIAALKENPKVRYGAMSLGGLLLLFVLMWAASKMGGSTILSEQNNLETSNAETPLLGGAGGGLDSIAEYQRLLQTAVDLKDKKRHEQAILYADSALLFKPEDKDALALKKDAETAPKEQSKPEKDAAESKIAQSDAAKKEQERISQYNQLLADASKAYDKGQYKTAKSKYQEALQLNPSERSYLQGKIGTIDKILNPPPKPQKPLTKTVPLGMVRIKGGTFQMGSNDGSSDEKPVHSVTLDDFYMDEAEVTVAQFERFVNAKGYKTDAEKEGDSYAIVDCSWEKKSGVTWRDDVFGNARPKSHYNHPVIHVSWNDANAYAKWAGKRLPTEAEWEYAARCGSKGYKYAWGNGSPTRSKGGNLRDETTKQKCNNWTDIWEEYNDGYFGTAPVKQFGSNCYGLYDMTGNVWEWCADWYDENYYSNSLSSNPRGATTGSRRVLRGGSWSLKPHYCRSANRDWNLPSSRLNYLGFRCAKTP